MGAGSRKEHYAQDAGEAYVVAHLQQLAASQGLAFKSDGTTEHDDFVMYCEERNILEYFIKTDYYSTANHVLPDFFLRLTLKFPGEKFWFEDVEKDSRNESKKRDFVIHALSGWEISISLKNYKKGFRSIQLHAQTFGSFIAPFIFEKMGVGQIKDPVTGEQFNPTVNAHAAKRDTLLIREGYAALIPHFDELNAQLANLQAYYVLPPHAEQWNPQLAKKWADDCISYGNEGARILLDMLNLLSLDQIKTRIVDMVGFDGSEDLLVMGAGKYACSLFDSKWDTQLHRLNSTDSSVRFYQHKKAIRFEIFDDQGVILYVLVPLSLNKQGGWHKADKDGSLDGPTSFLGTQEITERNGKKYTLRCGQRRPFKIAQLATSTNTYVKLGDMIGNVYSPSPDLNSGGLTINVDGIEDLIQKAREAAAKKKTLITKSANKTPHRPHNNPRFPDLNKKQAAQILYKEYIAQGKTSHDIIELFQEELTMNKPGATTYYGYFK